MIRNKSISAVFVTTLVACFCLSIILSAEDMQNPLPDNEKELYWGQVDLTQYCGKPVGDLLDDLGGKYDSYGFYAEHTPKLTSCTFSYGNIGIEIMPMEFQYCNIEKPYGEWNIMDFEKERLGLINVAFFENDSINKSETENCKGKYAINYPQYIGKTIETLLNDIRRPYTDGFVRHLWTFEGPISVYDACVFKYPGGLEIIANFEKALHQPSSRSGLINDVGEFLDQRIGSLFITVVCEYENN